MFSEKGDQRLKVRMKPIWILMKLRRRVRPLRPSWSRSFTSVVTIIYSGSALHVVVQLLSHVWLCKTMDCNTPGFPILHLLSLLKLISIESVKPSNHLILCRPLLLLPSIFPSIRVFSNESALHIKWPKYWSFSFSISPSNEHPGLISFRVDWSDLRAVQGTLKSSSPAPHFKSINSLALNFLYGLTHIHTWLLEKP